MTLLRRIGTAISGSPAVRRVSRALGRADRALLRVRDAMTPSQRWTAALALVLVIVVLAYGLPRRVVEVPAAAAPASAPVGAPPVVTAPSPPSVPGLRGPALPPSAPPAPPPASPPSPAPTPIPVDIPPPHPPTVVALAAPQSPSGVPTRDDAAMASAYAATTSLPSVVVTDSGSPHVVCAAAARAGTVALSAHPLRPGLETCLRQRGLVVISPSPFGTRRAHRGAALSLGVRRGDVASVADAARWGLATTRLSGKVGLVLDADRRADLQRVPGLVRRAGVDVRATSWLAPDVPADSLLRAVAAFGAAGITRVVFAAPVALQSKWAADASALRLSFGYVVTDVDDGVTNEQYPPTFDGATAYTSLRVPWYSRDYATTGAQAACEATWTAAATPPIMLPGEDVPAYTWCEEVGLLKTAVAAALLREGDLAATLLRLRWGSPLTSTLGPLPGGGWGPRANAALVWHATCECWQQLTPFRSRHEGHPHTNMATLSGPVRAV